jgi:hypothetical protein
VLQGTIEGRRDIAGGRLASDRRAAGNRTSGQCFTSLAFSADGSMLLAAGASKCVAAPTMLAYPVFIIVLCIYFSIQSALKCLLQKTLLPHPVYISVLLP